MPLGREVGHGPGDVVLGGDPDPQKGARLPVFGPCLLWPNGWVDEDATATWCTGYGSTLCLKNAPTF